MLLILLHAFLVLLDAGLLLYFVRMPVWQGEESFFGVRVSPEVYRGPGRQILHRYRAWLVAAFMVIEAAALAVPVYLARTSGLRIDSVLLPRVGALLALSLAATILYSIAYRRAAASEAPQARGPVALSLKARRLSDYTDTGLEVLVAVLTAVPVVVLVCRYHALPGQVSAHLDSRGEVSELVRKSLPSVFGIPALIVYAQGWFLLIKHGLVRGGVTLPAEHTGEYLLHKEEALRVSVRLLDMLRGLFALPLVYVSLMTIYWSAGQFRQWAVGGTAFGLTWGMLVLVCFNHYVKRLMGINRRLKEEAGRVYVERPVRAGHWLAGKLFYYDRDNPALFVETPVGPSYTYNLGNKWSYAHLTYLGGLGVLIALVLKFI